MLENYRNIEDKSLKEEILNAIENTSKEGLNIEAFLNALTFLRNIYYLEKQSINPNIPRGRNISLRLEQISSNLKNLKLRK